ncbi:hypothetical protein HZY97_20360 [Sphingomonas sp. R-74633]|uniref:hypothetical protein n=1 Tax=Sphingomonas sp. R-74633 TaxID=2751188 RepID=UPI0015D30B26|nr:hypothetical protein [Sphingomonas sp. R-74633]NYT43140.1 hypothetical protein [Sphingomonas sp. R-74633]
MKLFEPKVANQLFCCPKHNSAWHDRSKKRGVVLIPLVITARVTRNGTQGKPEAREAGRRASNRANQLMREYRDDDRAANEGRGRMEWTEYTLWRIKLGLDLNI